MATDMHEEMAALRADVAALRDEVAVSRARLDDYETALAALTSACRSRRPLRDRSGLRLAPSIAVPAGANATRSSAALAEN